MLCFVYLFIYLTFWLIVLLHMHVLSSCSYLSMYMSSGRDLHRSHSYDPNLLLHRPSAVPGLEKGIKHYMSDLVLFHSVCTCRTTIPLSTFKGYGMICLLFGLEILNCNIMILIVL